MGFAYVPAGHELSVKAQDDAPLVENEPPTQDRQAPTDAPPGFARNFPATQETQELGGAA